MKLLEIINKVRQLSDLTQKLELDDITAAVLIFKRTGTTIYEWGMLDFTCSYTSDENINKTLYKCLPMSLIDEILNKDFKLTYNDGSLTKYELILNDYRILIEIGE